MARETMDAVAMTTVDGKGTTGDIGVETFPHGTGHCYRIRLPNGIVFDNRLDYPRARQATPETALAEGVKAAEEWHEKVSRVPERLRRLNGGERLYAAKVKTKLWRIYRHLDPHQTNAGRATLTNVSQEVFEFLEQCLTPREVQVYEPYFDADKAAVGFRWRSPNLDLTLVAGRLSSVLGHYWDATLIQEL
jgi:hypothetical protein